LVRSFGPLASFIPRDQLFNLTDFRRQWMVRDFFLFLFGPPALYFRQLVAERDIAIHFLLILWSPAIGEHWTEAPTFALTVDFPT